MGVTKELIEDLRFLGGVFADMEQGYTAHSYEPSLENFSGVLEESHQQGFDSRQSPSGDSWPQWQFRAVDAPDDHETLEVSGRLRGSLKRGGADHVEQIGIRDMVWGTSVPYAAGHQTGLDFILGVPLVGRGGSPFLPAGTRLRIPQREHVGMSEATLEQLGEMVADATVESLKPNF